MKVDRYKLHPRFDAVELVIDPYGSVCYTRDVAKLEAKCAELEAKCAELETKGAELLEALKALIDNVGSCICYDESEREIKAWEMAEAAIAKAKGEIP